jgi:predicted oxidoreductase
MQQIPLGSSSFQTSRLAYGCWRIATSGTEAVDLQTARTAIHTAVELGYTLFDLADIYCGGRSESAFGTILRETPGLRERIVIATKCGIRPEGQPTAGAPYRYDLSADYIVASCEQSLRRLGIETIDLFQLHRPDWLMNAAEVAEAFAQLQRSGKVREFGVSNFLPTQVDLLQQACARPLLVNQVEISLLQLQAFRNGTLDQCQAQKITPMAWSPLGGGLLGEGAASLLPSQRVYQPAAVVAELDRISLSRGVSRTAVALAWLLRHPAGIVPIIGSTQPGRIRAAATAVECELSREEWYGLLTIALGERLP